MKRTTLILEESLMSRVKQSATAEGRTLTEQVHLLLREGLRSLKQSKANKFKLEIPTVKGKKTKVDISNREQLYDLINDDSSRY